MSAESKHDDLGFELPPPVKVPPRRARWMVVLAVVVLLGLFAAGLVPKLVAKNRLEAETAAAASSIPRVELISPVAITSDRDLVLPGSIEPLEQTIVYPRAQGYVKRWLADLGSQVKEGELLAEIDTPELDAQLEQAKAQVAQAEADVTRALASESFSKQNLTRYQQLAPAGVASQQELDRSQAQAQVDTSSVGVAKANVAAQQANLRRLVQLKSFSKVTAPFTGTVIARMVERGALVNPSTTPLFKLAAIETVRVLVQVPQDVAPSVKTQVGAKVKVREYAGEEFAGTVARSAGALDEVARTMTVEVRVPNPDGRLLTGMYAQVALTLPTPHRLWEVPVTALYSDSRGTRVATVQDGRVVMKTIGIERDTGQTLQISTGLDGTEKIVKLANAGLTEGAAVEVIQATEQKKPGT